MFDWIYNNREVFLTNYVEIGKNHGDAKKLQEEHGQFTNASNVSWDLKFRAGHLAFAVLQCSSKSYFQVNFTTKVNYF